MILDRLNNLRQYGALPNGISAAIEYLLKTDFSKTPEGRCELDGDRLFAIVQRYDSRPVAKARWEAHRRYIDVQYIFAGKEQMGHLLLREGLAIATPYNEEGDALFYEGPGTFFPMQPNDVAIFWPQDIHAPGIAVNDLPAKVQKVVVKCRIA
jgi:biofilm protein TabA